MLQALHLNRLWALSWYPSCISTSSDGVEEMGIPSGPTCVPVAPPLPSMSGSLLHVSKKFFPFFFFFGSLFFGFFGTSDRNRCFGNRHRNTNRMYYRGRVLINLFTIIWILHHSFRKTLLEGYKHVLEKTQSRFFTTFLWGNSGLIL